MQRLLLLFLCIAGFGLLSAQVVLEDFEGGTPDLPWIAYEGTFAGAVANPVDTTTNTSAFVGAYTKADSTAYSYFVAELAEPLDLSVNNRFSIQIYAGAPTQLLLKLEKPGGGQFIERTVNIATANVWRTYTFDFSAAAELDSLSNLILFFDPGVALSTDTYLFDNIIASPAGPCAGTVADPTIIDDFECQRNATYGAEFDSLMVIANPYQTGINTSDSVGQYTDGEGPYVALVVDYNAPLDLSVNNYVCMKVWAPVAGQLVFKLEGGTSVPIELGIPITEGQTEQWIEVCADFSGVSTGNFRKIALFFNFAVESTSGDVYYIDDITRTPAPPAEAIEDFEDGASLNWNTAAGNNGTFNGAIANPDMNGNDSETVGSYTRGSALFAALNANLTNGIDLTGAPQLNLDVWAPVAGTTVTLQLVSPTQGPKSANATVTAASTWETLSFNFADFEDVTDFESLTLLFAPNTTGTGTYYFDNLTAGSSTVDACVDVMVDLTYLDDFECQRNATYAGGSEFLSVIRNPDNGNESGNTSTMVGAFADQPGEYNSLVIDYGMPIDLSLNNQLSVQIWAPVAGDILFKLEGGTGADLEVRVPVNTVMEWNTYTADFSGAAGAGYTRLVLFFGAGTNNTAANTYYFDNLRLARAPYVNSCISTFENPDYSITNWTYFANGAFDANPFMVSENPDQTGINTSMMVGTFEEATDGESYAGMASILPAPVTLSGDKKATLKVWMEVAGTVFFKLEDGLDGAVNSGDIMAEYTTPGEWQELTFDYSNLVDGDSYGKITLIMNSAVTPATPLTHYFDDIAIGSGDCANTTGLFQPVAIDALRAYPNPISHQLTIENTNAAVRFTLTNMLGQQVRELNVEGAQTQVQWELESLERGAYLLTAQDRAGRMVARSMVVKR